MGKSAIKWTMTLMKRRKKTTEKRSSTMMLMTMRLERHTTEDSSSGPIMRLVPVFTLETNNQMNNECLPKFVQTHNASSSIKTNDLLIVKMTTWKKLLAIPVMKMSEQKMKQNGRQNTLSRTRARRVAIIYQSRQFFGDCD